MAYNYSSKNNRLFNDFKELVELLSKCDMIDSEKCIIDDSTDKYNEEQ